MELFALPQDPADPPRAPRERERAVLAASAATAETWDPWRTTVVDLELPDGRRATLRPEPGSCDFPAGYERFHVLTSDNPNGERLPPEVNTRRRAYLAARLERTGVAHWASTGRDPASDWHEPGFLVAGLTDDDARALGAALGQVAIFAWSPDRWSILACVTGRRTDLPWSLADRST